MTDTPEGASSKRAMEVARRVCAERPLEFELVEILDAEFRKGEALAKAVEAVLHGDYPRPPKNGPCKHGEWSRCEECIDEFLEPALAAYRSQP